MRTKSDLAIDRFFRKWQEAKPLKKSLTSAVQRVIRFHRSLSEADEDLAAFHAPSELGPRVYNALERDLQRDLAELGFPTEKSLRIEVAARTSDRFCYMHGI